MVQSSRNEETEIKFKVDDLTPFRKRLIALGAIFQGEEKEENFCFDTPQKDLYHQDKLLRLRKTKNKTIFTFKGPKQDRKNNLKKTPGLKIRKEIEVEISDDEQFKAILENLGYQISHRYDKLRESFSLEGTEIVLDTLPFLGNFLEIEGSEENIGKVLPLLGLDPKQALEKTYGHFAKKLFSEGGHFPTFGEEERINKEIQKNKEKSK